MDAHSTEVRSYHLDPAAFEVTTRRRVRQRLKVALPFLALVLAAQFAVTSVGRAEALAILPLVIGIVVAALALGAFLGARRELRQGRAAWDSYQLTLGPNVLRRFIAGQPAVEIARTEATRILELEAEGLTVLTSDPQRFAFIPNALLGFHEARARLASWRPVEPAPPNRSSIVSFAWAGVLIAGWFTAAAAPSLGWAVAGSAVLYAAGGTLAHQVRRSSVLSNERKAASIAALGFMLLTPVARLVLCLLLDRNVSLLP